VQTEKLFALDISLTRDRLVVIDLRALVTDRRRSHRNDPIRKFGLADARTKKTDDLVSEQVGFEVAAGQHQLALCPLCRHFCVRAVVTID